jgi:hypothetical protein
MARIAGLGARTGRSTPPEAAARLRRTRRSAMSGPTVDESQETEPIEEPGNRVDTVAILYILGGIPAIVAFIVILFLLVNLFPSIPA